MAKIPKLETDMDIIAKMGDDPRADDGLETDEFKSKFDEAGNIIKTYINEVLIPNTLGQIEGSFSMGAEQPEGPALWFRVTRSTENGTYGVLCYVDAENTVVPLTPAITIADIDSLQDELDKKVRFVHSESQPEAPALWFQITGQTDGKLIGNMSYIGEDNVVRILMPKLGIADISELQQALNKKTEIAFYSGILLSDGWGDVFPYEQTLLFDGIKETDRPDVDLDLSGDVDVPAINEAWSAILRVTSSNGAITAYCYSDAPLIDIPIQLKVVR